MNSVQALRTLQNMRGLPVLESELQHLCGPSGSASACEIVFDSSKRTLVCFLEMKSPLPDSDVRELGTYGFGNIVCIERPADAYLQGSTRTLSFIPPRATRSQVPQREMATL
jgi:hypothetical protein